MRPHKTDDERITRRPPIARRFVIPAREGAMRCPRCSYVLSYSDALLCRVGDTHYCPRCWSRVTPTEGLALAPATNGADRPALGSEQAAKEDDEADAHGAGRPGGRADRQRGIF